MFSLFGYDRPGTVYLQKVQRSCKKKCGKLEVEYQELTMIIFVHV